MDFNGHNLDWETISTVINENKTYQKECNSASPYESFKNFYQMLISNDGNDKSKISVWMNNEMQVMNRKSDKKAESLRNEGNKFYLKGANTDALRLYAKSLRCATYNGPEYGKALANRSAVSHSLGEYEECLKDIEICFKSAYPKELRPKIQLRQLQCYYQLNMEEEFHVHVHHFGDQFKGNAIFEELIHNKTCKNEILHSRKKSRARLTLNEYYAFASKDVKLCYDELCGAGRHVIAARNIKAGSVLFKEKAFIVAPIFTSDGDIVDGICYHCLKHITFSSVPCESCTYCIYCSDKCKKTSWDLGHRFECPGMIIWYALGHGLPAFKFVMKGVLCGFREPSHPSENIYHIYQFGNYIDNYPYANTLVTHFKEREDKVMLCSTAFVIVAYLKDNTDFFDYIRARVERANHEHVEHLIGGLLVKHMAQLFCNGCVVETAIQQPIAAAIYPSISMMNHSCSSNISLEYDGCIAIVRAAEDIPKGGQLFNNYGVDWNSMQLFSRQSHLSLNYFFDCHCEICLCEKYWPK